MIEYIYKTTILKNDNDTIGYDAVAEQANETDFETNYKTTAVKIDEVIIGATSLETAKTYAQFKALITGDLTWADVKFTSDNKFYNLYLITDTPL